MGTRKGGRRDLRWVDVSDLRIHAMTVLCRDEMKWAEGGGVLFVLTISIIDLLCSPVRLKIRSDLGSIQL